MNNQKKIIILAALGLLLSAATLMAAPKANLWSRWDIFDPTSSMVVDHSAWNRFLGRYVVTNHPSGINLVQYARVSPEDRRGLESYIDKLQTVAVSRLNRDEQMAYWINLYNAVTVKVILDHYPVSSITKINLSSGLLSRGPWDGNLLRIEGEEVSLNDVEHRILRPIWKDPRVHYAVNCASMGCPNLQEQAYTVANLEVLLEKGAREYINHPRGTTFQGKKLLLSSIYDWFQEDFGGSEEGVLVHLRRYASPELAGKLDSYGGRISYDYDWSLNE
jgi:hypothetical protein